MNLFPFVDICCKYPYQASGAFKWRRCDPQNDLQEGILEKLLLGPILEEHLVATSTYKGYWSFEQCFSSEAGCIYYFRDEIRISKLQGSIA